MTDPSGTPELTVCSTLNQDTLFAIKKKGFNPKKHFATHKIIIHVIFSLVNGDLLDQRL